jgi:hypothetical protein
VLFGLVALVEEEALVELTPVVEFDLVPFVVTLDLVPLVLPLVAF